jgi:hypothetical protein
VEELKVLVEPELLGLLVLEVLVEPEVMGVQELLVEVAAPDRLELLGIMEVQALRGLYQVFQKLEEIILL